MIMRPLPDDRARAAVVIGRVLGRTADDAIRLASYLRPSELEELLIVARDNLPAKGLVAIAALLFAAGSRVDRRQALADADRHHEIIAAPPKISGVRANAKVSTTCGCRRGRYTKCRRRS